MTDIVDAATRSRMMAGIQGKNTKPEMIVRKYLHSRGYRFRLHRKDLPGRPDLVLPKYMLAIFVHGCFWHRHTHCFYAKMPSTRVDFWREKLSKNVERDLVQVAQLIEMGWRVLVIWECGIKASDGALSFEGAIASNEKFQNWPMSPPRTVVFLTY